MAHESRQKHQRQLQNRLAEYLQDVHGVTNAKNFRCLAGTHEDKHPSMSLWTGKDGVPRVKCFSCNFSADLFDLIGKDQGVTGLPAQYEAACRHFHETPIKGVGDSLKADAKPMDWNSEIRVDPGKPGQIRDKIGAKESQVEQKSNNQNKQQEASGPVILTAKELTPRMYAAYTRLQQNPEAAKHFHDRGFTDETIKRFKLGFAPEGWNGLFKGTGKESKAYKQSLYRYVIPYMDAAGNCISMNAEIADRQQIDEYNGKYKKIEGQPAPYFNEHYLTAVGSAPDAIFLTEGVYDAISAEQAGAPAVALNGAQMTGRLQDILKNRREPLRTADGEKTAFIDGLDTDVAGRKAAGSIREMLKECGYEFIEPPAREHKDFNAFLQESPEDFADYIYMASRPYESGQNDQLIDDYLQAIYNSQFQEVYPTGLKELDRVLNGGFSAGLYTIGAVSGLGKTTFMAQVLDNAAAAGKDVLIFALEMSALEMTAKSVSRLTARRSVKDAGSFKLAKTTNQVMDGKKWKYFSDEEKSTVLQAIRGDYKAYARNVRIMSGMGVYTVNDIKKAIDRHIRKRGKRPAVLVDYIQILQPVSPELSERQAIDRNVLELKQISRDFGVPIIAVSSLNRTSYNDPITMAAFKESGALEYTSDVLIGLQYKGMDIIAGEKDSERKARIADLAKENKKKADVRDKGPAGHKLDCQEIEIKILKNRHGLQATAGAFFIPAYNIYFEDGDEIQKATTAKDGQSETGGAMDWETVMVI